MRAILIFFVLCAASALVTSDSCYNATVCYDGVVLPLWAPVKVDFADSVIRAVVYFIALMYAFMGVSIIAERFMAAIETITSKERQVIVKMKTGDSVVVRVRVWNETVSNLTLMALGSSAPEILLSIIEICGKNFEAGSLGPGTIVGSAAFNLFIIIGICIIVVPNGESRKIKHLPVFAVTATFSIVAYLWLYLIIGVISIGVIEVWEAVITFLLFPLTVVMAYLADKKLFISQFGGKRYFVNNQKSKIITDTNKMIKANDIVTDEFDDMREKYIFTLRELRKEHPGVNLQTLEKMATTEIIGKSKKSRAFYKMMVTKKFIGGGDLMNQSLSKLRLNESDESEVERDTDSMLQTVYFDPCHYTIMENVGTVSVTVKRSGGFLGSMLYVDYVTEDATATCGEDYVFTEGSLKFLPYETEKNINIRIMNDNTFEEDEHFSIKLDNLKIVNGKENFKYKYEISETNKATVMILDDDHAGTFYFQSTVLDVVESCGVVNVIVQRSTGARGTVSVPYKTIDGSAKSGDDYISQDGELIFHDNETYKTIEINIIDDGKYEKSEYFLIRLGEPELIECRHSIIRNGFEKEVTSEEKHMKSGIPKLGEWNEIKITIKENVMFKGIVDKMLKRANLSVTFGASTWKEQFHDAITVNSGEVDEDGKEIMPSLLTFILHYLTIFWKVLFALVPPTEYLSGWLCFIVSVICIGLLTALLGDLASSFGCSIGLLDEVTAITFVAIGTSLPDTFASKVSAIQDDTADSSIGNVTGSNAVNVFLGLGIAWTIATIVHAYRGTVFLVPLGSLGFSVTIFCILAIVTIAILIARRDGSVGGELGGPPLYKYLSTGTLFVFFLIYVILSSLKAYCHI